MSKWRYTLLGWLVWKIWKRRLRNKLHLAPGIIEHQTVAESIERDHARQRYARARIDEINDDARNYAFSNVFEIWNRKLHYYVGLYLLTFVWLFAVSGLIINHPGWAFADFWPNPPALRPRRSGEFPKR